MFKQESLKKAEEWLALKGWENAGMVINGNYWRQPGTGLVVPSITAVELQILKDWWG